MMVEENVKSIRQPCLSARASRTQLSTIHGGRGEEMNIAILFDSTDPKFRGNYGTPIREEIMGTSILQGSNRRLGIRHGDVLIHSHARCQDEYERIAEETYFAPTWSLLNSERIRKSYMWHKLYAIVVENVTLQLAEDLDAAIQVESSYMGLHAIDYSRPKHLVLYRLKTIRYCWMRGTVCTLRFGSCGEKDKFEADRLMALGFTRIRWDHLELREWPYVPL